MNEDKKSGKKPVSPVDLLTGPYVIVHWQPFIDHPYYRPYRSPTEDEAIGNIIREWRREQKRIREHEAFLERKATWEVRHPGKIYEHRKRFNTQVWKAGDGK